MKNTLNINTELLAIVTTEKAQMIEATFEGKTKGQSKAMLAEIEARLVRNEDIKAQLSAQAEAGTLPDAIGDFWNYLHDEVNTLESLVEYLAQSKAQKNLYKSYDAQQFNAWVD